MNIQINTIILHIGGWTKNKTKFNLYYIHTCKRKKKLNEHFDEFYHDFFGKSIAII